MADEELAGLGVDAFDAFGGYLASAVPSGAGMLLLHTLPDGGAVELVVTESSHCPGVKSLPRSSF